MAEWVFHAGSIGLLGMGGLLILIVVWTRLVPLRHKAAARRCPKCGYDMEHTHGMRCSECGFEARSEKQLHRRRVRWRFAAVGLLLMLLSYGAFATPRVRERGWVGAVPSTLLIAGMPALRPNMNCLGDRAWDGTHTVTAAGWRESLFHELVANRVIRDELWQWQEALANLVCRLQAHDEISPHDLWPTLQDRIVATLPYANGQRVTWYSPSDQPVTVSLSGRSDWPAGADIYLKVDATKVRFRDIRIRATPTGDDGGAPWSAVEYAPIECGLGLSDDPWNDGLHKVGTARAGASTLTFRCELHQTAFSSDAPWCDRWKALPDVGATADFQVIDSIEELATPVADQRMTNELAKALSPVIFKEWYWQMQEEEWSVSPTSGEDDYYEIVALFRRHPDVTFGFRLQILCSGRTIWEGEAWYRSAADDDIHPWGWSVIVEDIEDAALSSAKDGELTLRLIGDGNVALRDEKCRQFWAGTVEVPLTVILPAPPPPS